MFRVYLAVGVFVFFISLVLVVFGYQVYPTPGTDSLIFLAPALNAYNGNGLTNSLFQKVTEITDPTGLHRMTYYPPFFPMLIKALLFEGTPQNVFLLIGLINALTLCIWTFIWLTHFKTTDWRFVVFLCVALLALAATFNGRLGRPETLMGLLVSTATFFVLYFKESRWKYLSIGFVFGLLYATSFVMAVLFTFILAGYYAWREEVRKLAVISFFIILGAVVSFSLVFLWSPFSFLETISGIVRHGLLFDTELHFSFRSFLNYFILTPVSPFFVVVMFVAGCLGFRYMWQKRHDVCTPIVFWTCVISLVAAILYFSFLNLKPYYIRALAPFVIAFILFYLWNTILGKRHLFRAFVLGGMMFFVGLGFLVDVALWIVSYGKVATLPEARAEFLKLEQKLTPGEKIGIMTDQWVLGERYDTMYIWDGLLAVGEKGKFIISRSGRSFGETEYPKEIRGCIFEYAPFRNVELDFYGLNIGPLVPNYAFYVYLCERSME